MWKLERNKALLFCAFEWFASKPILGLALFIGWQSNRIWFGIEVCKNRWFYAVQRKKLLISFISLGIMSNRLLVTSTLCHGLPYEPTSIYCWIKMSSMIKYQQYIAWLRRLDLCPNRGVYQIIIKLTLCIHWYYLQLLSLFCLNQMSS